MADVEWLNGLYAKVAENSEWGTSSALLPIIKRLITSITLYDEKPFTLKQFHEVLQSYSEEIDQQDLALVKNFTARSRPRTVKKADPFSQIILLDEAVDKRIVLKRWPDNLEGMYEKHATLAEQQLKQLGMAISGLKKYKRASKLWATQVKRLALVWRKDYGTEDASWTPDGTIRIVIGKEKTDVKTLRNRIIHELGHALEQKSGLTVTKWDTTPYGNPPFISEYATLNPSEDFAETFAALELEPRRLKTVAPTKFAHMEGQRF